MKQEVRSRTPPTPALNAGSEPSVGADPAPAPPVLTCFAAALRAAAESPTALRLIFLIQLVH